MSKLNSNSYTTDDSVQGEGNYKAGREYQQSQRDFAKDKGRVKQGAEKAAKALDGPESEELERARKKSAQRGSQ
jgi:hypothetical protein